MMDAWHALHWLHPQWLWALALLPVLVWLLAWWRQRRNPWNTYVDAHLLARLVDASETRRRWGGVLAGALAYALLVLAMAGPSWSRQAVPLWQSHAPLVVALDLSSRIEATDMPPSRLLQARAKLAELLQRRQDGEVALVAYAEDAFTVAPLTDDVANITLYLDELAPAIMPIDGQRPERAIAHAVKLLQQAGFHEGDIVLMTDQGSSQAEVAARQAATQGFRVSVLGLGSAQGAAYQDRAGRIEQARLDAASLKSLASAGNGRYSILTAGDGDLQALGVLQAGAAEAYRQASPTLVWQDQGYWLILPLMLLCLLVFRRGVWLSAFVLASLLPLAGTARAAEGDWWLRSDQQAHAQLEQGAQAYRQGDFAAAEQAFAGLQSADGRYNHANALAKQGRYDEAIAAYDAALALQPGMPDAVANRAAVEAARKRQQQSGDGSSSSSGQQGKSAAGPSGQGQSSPSQGTQANGKPAADAKPPTSERPSPNTTPDKRTPPPARSQASSPPAEQPADASKQAAADQAQKQRMQQALEQAQGQPAQATAGQAGAVAKAESAEERERRQAVDAWLRRVPDEPGGLLKRKFQIEQERRTREGP